MLEGYHFQNAYVTRDIEKGIAAFRTRARVDKEIVYEGASEVMTPAGLVTQTCKLAFLWVGDLQYELIQPVSGAVDIYRDGLPADDGLAFHHVCMRIDDWDDFRARVDRQPCPVVMERATDPSLRFLYLDAHDLVGHYLEYVCMSDERWAQMGGK
jgi:hypothetical protein